MRITYAYSSLNGGHLGGHDGFYELPQLLESLEKMF